MSVTENISLESDSFLNSDEGFSATTEPRLYKRDKSSVRTTIFLIIAVAFILTSGNALMSVPGTRIFEDIICHHYYESSPDQVVFITRGFIDEDQCKGKEVQAELATLKGVWAMIDAIPGVFLAFPYGLLADRIGRRKVFSIAMVGVVLSAIVMCIICWFWEVFPLRLIWVTPVFQIIGGGNSVIVSMLFTMIADVSPAEDRSNWFFRLMVGCIAGEIVAPSLAAALMVRSPWIPLLLGLGTVILGASLIILVPSTLDLRSGSSKATNSTSAQLDEDIAEELEPQLFHSSNHSRVISYLHSLVESLSIFRSKAIMLLLTTFLISQLLAQFTNLSTQYISAQFSWSLSRAGYLTTMRAIVVILTLLVFLPQLSRVATRFSRSSTSADLHLARLSILFYIVGGVLVAIPNIAIAIVGLITFSLGAGFSSLCRSVITSLVDQQHTARLYAMVSVADTIGAFLAPPFMTLLFNSGLKRDGWLGLPFFGAACLMSIVGVALWAVQLPSLPEDKGSSENLNDIDGAVYQDVDGGDA